MTGMLIRAGLYFAGLVVAPIGGSYLVRRVLDSLKIRAGRIIGLTERTLVMLDFNY
jgi:hypothetical protein